MRLTNSMRKAIVQAILDDVPQTDFRAERDKIVIARAIKALPPKIKAVYDDASLRGFLNVESHSYQIYVSPDGELSEQNGDDYRDVWFWLRHVGDKAKLTDDEWQQIVDLDVAEDEQNGTMAKLRTKLEGVIKSVTTTQSFVKLVPEFEKYVPTEAASSKNLPALANLVTDFVMAGWPKGGKKEK